MSAYTASSLEVPAPEAGVELTRVDLIFYGVDHSGPSYEARVFINHDSADVSTERTFERGYVGSFTVFGHGGCYGDIGHCDINDRTTDDYDLRLAHPLTPWTKTLIMPSEAFELIAGSKVSITVVAVAQATAGAVELAMSFDRVRIAAYAA